MLDWWSELPAWLRYGVAIVFLLVGGLVMVGGGFRFGAAAVAIGFALLVVGGPSDSEKKGYRF
jgi:hypothetical protein